MTFRSDATEGVWSPTQNVAVQTEANVVAIFFFHQCGFYDPTHHIRGCQKIIWNFALKGRALIQPNNHTDAHKCWKALTGANCVIIVERHRKVLETYSFHLSVKNPCA